MNPQEIRLRRVLIVCLRHAQRAGHIGAGKVRVHIRLRLWITNRSYR